VPGLSDSTAADPGSPRLGPGGGPRAAAVTPTGSGRRTLFVPVLATLLLVTCRLFPLLLVAALSLGLVSGLARPSSWAVVLVVVSILVFAGRLSYCRRPRALTAVDGGKEF
jgi:hypothetical protein